MNQWRHNKHFRLYASIIILLLLGGIGFGGYKIYHSFKYIQAELQTSKERVAALEIQNAELGGTLSETQSKNEELDKDLDEQRKRVRKYSKEADMYKKLATTDKQLLAKYSKVYFLNENYAPTKLADINEKYVLPVGKKLQFLDPALPYLEDLLEDAEEDGVAIRIVSSYRSFSEQQALKSSYKVIYGAGTANSFSADQGYSEHQLGTTVDFTTPALVGAAPSFANTAAHKWLLENAYKYGFILSYPKSNSYYIYEPWHWRFVGEDLAQDLHEDKKNFYDLDQREIDDYLINIFD